MRMIEKSTRKSLLRGMATAYVMILKSFKEAV
jgi:hypothetical protein